MPGRKPAWYWTITGTEKSDVICGTAADDWVKGKGGNDAAYGGPSNDALFGEAGNDRLYGGGGNDALTDDEGVNVLDGGDGDDVLATASRSNGTRLLGGPGRDELHAYSLNPNYLDGGPGNDWASVDPTLDTIVSVEARCNSELCPLNPFRPTA